MPASRSTSNSKTVQATPERAYAAFMNQEELMAWLPPEGMTSRLHAFDARVGGGYQMSLYYAPEEQAFRGKTTDREDRVEVRFVELTPPQRIVETVRFVTTDPAFLGEMTMTATFEAVPGGTNVTMRFENLPPGLRAEDNEVGTQFSLDQLAHYLERRA